MADVTTAVVAPDELSAADRDTMFTLMCLVYDGMTRDHFDADLGNKDEVITLRDEDGTVVGFSTQRFVHLDVDGRRVTGVFSGDTVIHPDHWGSPALFQAFARRYFAVRDEPWYWFLISKGHRTYRMLPTFFTEFWPDRRAETPADAQAIMHAYATHLFGDEYNPATGVIEYREAKDRLRDGMAGVTEQLMRNGDVAHFVALNPGHETGHDLVCLAELSPDKLRPAHRTRLLGAS